MALVRSDVVPVLHDAAWPATATLPTSIFPFAATPAQDALRPQARTPIRNLFLAGDWTRTGLPATLEGAVRSGDTAAHLAARHLKL